MVSSTIQHGWDKYLQGKTINFEDLNDNCERCCKDGNACLELCYRVKQGMVNFIEDCEYHGWDDLLSEGHQMILSVEMHEMMLQDTVRIIKDLQVRFLIQVFGHSSSTCI